MLHNRAGRLARRGRPCRSPPTAPAGRRARLCSPRCARCARCARPPCVPPPRPARRVPVGRRSKPGGRGRGSGRRGVAGCRRQPLHPNPHMDSVVAVTVKRKEMRIRSSHTQIQMDPSCVRSPSWLTARPPRRPPTRPRSRAGARRQDGLRPRRRLRGARIAQVRIAEVRIALIPVSL